MWILDEFKKTLFSRTNLGFRKLFFSDWKILFCIFLDERFSKILLFFSEIVDKDF